MTQPGAGRPVTVLLVDDDPDVRELIARMLTRAGMHCDEAENGEDALAAVRADPPDVVLLDRGLPGMDGLAVLRALRADPRTATTPVILLTGMGEVEQRVVGLEAGADDYVVKSVEPDELVARVQAQLRGRRRWESALARRWTERSALAAELASDDAAAVVTAFAELADAAGAVLLECTGERAAVLAASDGFAWHAGELLPHTLTVLLRRRALDGPWTDADGLPTFPARDARTPGAVPCTFVPLHAGARFVGLLGVAVVGGLAGGAWPASVLASALDLAPVVAGIVAARAGIGEEGADARRAAITVATQSITTVFQPVVELASRATVGYEAMTRFADGRDPAATFAEARELGVHRDLEVAALAAAVRAAQALPHGFLAVHLSAATLLDAPAVADLIARAQRAVVVEISAEERIADDATLRAAVRSLPPGTELAIDDAGSGQASLRHLVHLAPAFVKLDREWIAAVDHDTAGQALVAGLAYFASYTGARLVAKGVETEAEATSLAALGVVLAQGELLGAPAPAPAP